MITVRDLAADSHLNCTLMTGLQNADRPIGGAAANEHADPTAWLTSNELLMTDGLGLGRTRQATTAYVERVARANIAGIALGIGEGLPYEEVPAALISACETYQIPLLSVPRTTPFARMTEAIYNALAQDRFGEAERMLEAQSRLTRAAARPQSSPEVIKVLSDQTGLWVVLTDLRGSTITSAPFSESPLKTEYVDLFGELFQAGLTSSATRPMGDGYVRLRPVGTEAARGVLAYGSRSGLIDEFSDTVATFAVSLLSIDIERRKVVSELQRRPREEALRRILSGVSTTTAARLLSAVGVIAPRVKVALIASPQGSGFVEALSTDLPQVLAREERDLIWLLAPADMVDLEDRLVDVLGGCAVGLGGSVRPHDSPASARQARHALTLAQERGGGLVDAMSLGAATVLLRGASADSLRAFAQATLGPLEEADSKLLVTLRAWIDACGMTDSAAAAIGVHRHTMRNRMQRIARITGRSLDSSRDRGELWLAFEARDLVAVADE